jgi:hypothetical protein
VSGIHVSARSFAGYRSVFTLSEHDLSLRGPDRPGCAAGFVARATARDPQASAERGALPKKGPGPRSGPGSHDPVRWRHLDPPP